ncbi:energy coupling factor transporter S component ThiW [Pyrobaculum aerophilum]|uniref:Energy coupling factor transporter S component ThiW n=1 Tax=Pyrobaculum aerophilum TaxID=13773 RepID=A0A371R019_9CREN|nr:energy coupling factor transporter S component ThiW [Pyrobaculum aerophilum]RFA96340.1 energy coupling factor transporter S component ThiW [Pyrobaculum aerophilum]RFA96629.1 energy coupling factor transporter S component ThiW [Pyrobaculum aerophilum]
MEYRVVAYLAVFTGLGLALAPLSFPVGPTRAFPGQHFVNGVAGVVIGPWALAVAFLVSLIRNMLGLGTVFAFPGSIPGALIVWLAATALRRFGKAHYAPLFEPLGTLGLGFPAAAYVVAPLLGVGERFITGLIPIFIGWAASTITGSIAAFFVAVALRRLGRL